MLLMTRFITAALPLILVFQFTSCQSNIRKVTRGDWDSRKAALEKISDQKTLKEITLNKRVDKLLRATAVSKIHDQAFLQMLALDTSFPYQVRVEAIKGVKNEELLQRITLNSALDHDYRSAAVGGISDQSFLMNLINDPQTDYDIRRDAIKSLTDQTELMKVIYTKFASDYGKEIAIEHISNQKYLKQISVDNRMDIKLREIAASRITNQEYLKEIVIDDSVHYKIRRQVITQLDNPEQDFLLDIFLGEEPSKNARPAIVKRIINPNLLLATARGDSIFPEKNYVSFEVRKAAINKLIDVDVVVDIYHDSFGYGGLRKVAAMRVQCLLGSQNCWDDEKYPRRIRKYSNIIYKLMFLLLSEPVMERHGLLRLDLTASETSEEYTKNPGAFITSSLTVTNFTVQVFDMEGHLVISRDYTTTPPQFTEKFIANYKERVAEIDFDEIRRLLLE